ncbi:hypothetical protein K443DRAFT_444335 [Laccaria amethystina LaAM-08-1]|uniref:Unplaced genomic scaffold K443scaffold_390, whole genome shotgun sequence n=1 Tax=Laccaria amethystina LaAM-08-1 TaxID=1095629 RepID=A0A0C9WNS8_9AGAR|nr:hypothetical protein K443DRAFT_444335 [Laccaria amethystina LaAM-08-1]
MKDSSSFPFPNTCQKFTVHYDTTFDNELGVPFIMITWLDGIPLRSVWPRSASDTPEALERRKENVLRSAA